MGKNFQIVFPLRKSHCNSVSVPLSTANRALLSFNLIYFFLEYKKNNYAFFFHPTLGVDGIKTENNKNTLMRTKIYSEGKSKSCQVKLINIIKILFFY
jgi:hypothetical protein